MPSVCVPVLDGTVWSKEDCLTLLERIRSLLPDADSLKYKTTESHFDWDKVGFGNFTGDMCKQKWQKVSTEVSQLTVRAHADMRVCGMAKTDSVIMCFYMFLQDILCVVECCEVS